METLNTSRAKALYRTLWRWHFYAGLFAIPFVIILSISGAIYLFKPQIDNFNNAPFNNLSISGEPATADQHLAAALAALPNSVLNAYQLPAQPNDAVQILLTQGKDLMRVYVHPQTLTILQIKNDHSGLLKIAHDIHGELLLGKPGAILVELAASWAIVLVLTGLYLWWPRTARGLGGVLYPRLSLKGRLFWRDLHSVVGIWSSLLVLFLLISGLPWALVWGSAFKEVRQLTGAVNQDWVIAGTHTEHLTQANTSQPPGTSAPLETIVKSAIGLQFVAPVLIYPPVKTPEKNSASWQARSSVNWTVKSITQNRPLRADAQLDAISGQLVSRTEFSQRHLIDRIIGIGVAAHEGQLFGWFNQLLGLLVTISLIATSVSGFYMWRKRKPQFSLGAPPAVELKLGYGFMATILCVALCLPVLACSLVLLFILERGLLTHWGGARRWLLGAQ